MSDNAYDDDDDENYDVKPPALLLLSSHHLQLHLSQLPPQPET